MNFRLTNPFKFLQEIEENQRLKIFLLAVCFFIAIGGYTLVKELKDFVFVSIVGSSFA